MCIQQYIRGRGGTAGLEKEQSDFTSQRWRESKGGECKLQAYKYHEHFSKSFWLVINKKLITWAEECGIWGEEESGFGKGGGGLENVYVMKEITEETESKGRNYTSQFQIQREAYDAINI